MLDTQLLALRRAAIALNVYATESRRTIDLADPRQAKRFAHVQDIEAVLTAAADVYDALTPPPTPLMQQVAAHLAQPHLQARLGYPHHISEALALITTHHLPRPTFLDECRLPPQP